MTPTYVELTDSRGVSWAATFGVATDAGPAPRAGGLPPVRPKTVRFESGARAIEALVPRWPLEDDALRALLDLAVSQQPAGRVIVVALDLAGGFRELREAPEPEPALIVRPSWCAEMTGRLPGVHSAPAGYGLRVLRRSAGVSDRTFAQDRTVPDPCEQLDPRPLACSRCERVASAYFAREPLTTAELPSGVRCARCYVVAGV